MNCSDAQIECQRFLDNELPAPVAGEIESHLASCPGCAGLFQSQRAFHTLVKKVLGSPTNKASARLREAIADELNAGGLRLLASPWRSLSSPHSSVATAAACMMLLTGLVGFQSACLDRQCSMVVAAQYEHDNIVAGNRSALASSNSPLVLAQSIGKRLGKIAGVPDLSDCSVKAERCGLVDIPGLPQGIFVKYIHCQCNNEAVTLMVIDTPLTPKAREVETFLAASQSGHNVISWRGDNGGPLFMLVSKIPMANAMEVARVARR